MRNKLAIAAALAVCAALAYWLIGRGDSDAPAGGSGSGEGAPGERRAGGSPLDDDDFGMQFRPGAWGGLRGRVEGTVIDVIDDAPAPYVDVIFKTALGEETATSNADGRYAIELATGRYEVRAMGERLLGLEQPPLLVGRVDKPIPFDVRVTRLAVIRGRVVDDRGSGVAGADVSYLPRTAAERQYTKNQALTSLVQSGDGGAFELEAIGGDVHLEAVYRLRGGARRGHAVVAAVLPGTERDGVEIALGAAGRLAGVVVDPRGRPVAGADVHLAVTLPVSRARQREDAVTDDAGRFEFPAVMAGRASLEARAEGWSPSIPFNFDFDAKTDQTDHELRLQTPAAVSGRVVDEDDRPVAGIVVTARRKVTWMGNQDTTTSSDGTFVLPTLDAGPYELSARSAGYATARVDGIVAPAEGIVLRLRENGALRGIVTDPNRKPVAGFVVRVEQYVPIDSKTPRRTVPATRVFAEDGRFEIADLEPGAYDIEIDAAGYAAARVLGIEVPPGSYGDGSVALVSGSSINGTVTDAVTGKPIAGARLSLFGGPDGATVASGSDGSFAIDNVSPGLRSVRALHPGYLTLARGVEVAADKAVTLDVALTPRGSRQVEDTEVVGIGVVIEDHAPGILLRGVIKGGPAAKAGVRVRDEIMSID